MRCSGVGSGMAREPSLNRAPVTPPSSQRSSRLSLRSPLSTVSSTAPLAAVEESLIQSERLCRVSLTDMSTSRRDFLLNNGDYRGFHQEVSGSADRMGSMRTGSGLNAEEPGEASEDGRLFPKAAEVVPYRIRPFPPQPAFVQLFQGAAQFQGAAAAP